MEGREGQETPTLYQRQHEPTDRTALGRRRDIEHSESTADPVSAGKSCKVGDDPGKPAWYKLPHYSLAVKVVAGIVLVGTFYTGVIKKNGDFQNHYGLGQGFLEGSPYLLTEDNHDPFCAHYPPGRLVLDALFALPPYRLSRALNWALALVGLVISLRWWLRLSRPNQTTQGAVAYAAATLALFITLRWLVRDLADCGQQLLLVWALSAAAWWLSRGKDWSAGGVLGLAATYKATPLLFLPLLLYKRKWGAAAVMGATILLLNVAAPVMFLGVSGMVEASKVYGNKARQIITDAGKDPTINGVEPAKHQNRNLTFALARFLMRFEPGHPLFIAHPDDATTGGVARAGARPHPLFWQFLDLSPRRAGQVIKAVLLVLGLVLAIRYRRPWHLDSGDTHFAAEWTAVMGLCAILSPLCWGQHMVLLVPALFVVLLAHLGGGGLRRRTVAICLIALLILGPQRELLGRELSLVLHSYKLDTVAALLILWLVLSPKGLFRSQRGSAVRSAPHTPGYIDPTSPSEYDPRTRAASE